MTHEHLPSAEHSLPPGVCTDSRMPAPKTAPRVHCHHRALLGSEAQNCRQLLCTGSLHRSLCKLPIPGLHASAKPVSRATPGCLQPTPRICAHNCLSRAHALTLVKSTGSAGCPGLASSPNPILPPQHGFSVTPLGSEVELGGKPSPVFWFGSRSRN